MASQPPIARVVPKEIAVHDDTRIDNYFWLRDRTDPDVVAYLEAENRYTEELMAPAQALREKLYKEILGRIQETDLSVPVKRDEYFYYTRTEEGKAYSIHCRKHGSLEAAEEILLDSNVLAEGQKYFRVGNFAVSPDHRLLAYSIDTEGDEAYTIFVKDLASGELLRGPHCEHLLHARMGERQSARSFTPFSTNPSGRIACFATNSAAALTRWCTRKTMAASY